MTLTKEPKDSEPWPVKEARLDRWRETQAYREGVAAFLAGDSSDVNPYQGFDRQRWCQGFYEQRQRGLGIL
jgi:ribosome modulation factor